MSTVEEIVPVLFVTRIFLLTWGVPASFARQTVTGASLFGRVEDSDGAAVPAPRPPRASAGRRRPTTPAKCSSASASTSEAPRRTPQAQNCSDEMKRVIPALLPHHPV